ncbi:MAG: hypothetical protein WC901_03045 [Candidatus Margulisiibacteriota bacterium]
MSFDSGLQYGLVKPSWPMDWNPPDYENAFVQEDSSVDASSAKQFLSYLTEGLKFLPSGVIDWLTGDGEVEDCSGQGLAGATDAEGNWLGKGALSGNANIDFYMAGSDYSLFDDLASSPLSVELYNQYIDFDAVDLSGNWSQIQATMNKYLSNQNIYEFILSGTYRQCSSDELYDVLLGMQEIKREFTYAMCSIFGPFSALGKYTTTESEDGETKAVYETVQDEALLNQMSSFLSGVGAEIDCHNINLITSFFLFQQNLHYYMALILGQASPEDVAGLSAEEASAIRDWQSYRDAVAGDDMQKWQDIYDEEMDKAEDDRDQSKIATAKEKICAYQELFAPDSESSVFWSDDFSGHDYTFQPYLTVAATPYYAYGWDTYSAGDLNTLATTNATANALALGSAWSSSSWAQVNGYANSTVINSYQDNWAVVAYAMAYSSSTQEFTRIATCGAFNIMRYALYHTQINEYDDKLDAAKWQEIQDKKLAGKHRAQRRASENTVEARIASAHKKRKNAAKQASMKSSKSRQNQTQAVS